MNRPFWQTLAWRLTLAFVLVSALALGVVGLVSTASTRAQFSALVGAQAREALQEEVEAYLTANGSLAGFRPVEPVRGQQRGPRPSPSSSAEARLPERGSPESRSSWVVLDADHRAVFSTPDVRQGDQVLGRQETAISSNGRVVAYLVSSGLSPRLDPRSQEFLSRTAQAIGWAMLGATLIAVLMGLLLSRTLLKPLGDLMNGIHALQRGEAPTLPPEVRRDEFGEVLQAFSEMHQSVLRNQQARQQLTANIAHDLNTPLSVVGGTLEGILDGTFQPTAARLTRLHRETQYIAQLVNDLRFLSLADAGELRMNVTSTDLIALVDSALEQFHEVAERQEVTLQRKSGVEELVVLLDGLRLTQVLQNLLRNALAYTSAGGRVTVVVESTEEAAWVRVQDTGSGIATRDLPYVFDRLYRADSSRSTQGSGLGLSISRSIVEAHGGSIQIESTPGRGATVSLVLPRAGQDVKSGEKP